jgi:NADH-quinone oxidoreductase subunit I
LCSRVCPALAIEVQANETDLEKERYPEKFEINMVRCIFCGFCEEVCPEEAIIMSNEYELVFKSQEEAIFGKEKLLIPRKKLEKRLKFLKENR